LLLRTERQRGRVRPAEQIEQPDSSPGLVPHRRVRRSIAHRQRAPRVRVAVADVQLPGLRSPLQRVLVAVDQLVQQVGTQPEHPGGDRPAFGFVAVQQRLVAVERGGQFPAQVVGVLDTGVHALAAGGRVGVRGVACQQHPAVTEPLCETDVRTPDGHPGQVGENDVVAPAVAVQVLLEQARARLRVAGQRGGELELPPAGQR